MRKAQIFFMRIIFFVLLVSELCYGQGNSVQSFWNLDSQMSSALSISNVHSLPASRKFARELLSRIEAQDKTNNFLGSLDRPLEVYHLGNKIPRSLKMALTILADHGYYVKLEQITEEEFIEGREKNRKLLKMEFQSSSIPEMYKEGLFSNIRHNVEYIFGLQNGFTIWKQIPRTEEEKKQDLKKANKLGVFTYTSMAVVIGYQRLQKEYQFFNPLVYDESGKLDWAESSQAIGSEAMRFLDPEQLLTWTETKARMLITSLVFSAWLHWNQYDHKAWKFIVNQGVDFKRNQNGFVEAKTNTATKLLMASLRSAITGVGILVTDAIILSSFGSQVHFNPYNFAENTFLGVLARVEIDDWMKRNIKSGKWDSDRAGRYELYWAVVYNVVKNFHLLQIPILKNGLYLMVAINASMFVWDKVEDPIRRNPFFQKLSCRRSIKK